MRFEVQWDNTYAAIWRSQSQYLRPVKHLDPICLDDLLAVDEQKRRMQRNTERFIQGLPVNNALLWGARGTGKSSMIKALLNEYKDQGLRLVQVDKDDMLLLPEIVDEIRDLPYRYIIYCDDVSFEADDGSYKALKSAIEGSIELPPQNILIYATSNRRHLLPESMQDNLDSKLVDFEIHYSDAVEEKISLSERFGLWIGFYSMNMQQYLSIVDHYFAGYKIDKIELHKQAHDFALLRGAHSGRTAKQFFNHFSKQARLPGK